MYWSQNKFTCIGDVEHGCGPCSLSNALIAIGAPRLFSPLELCAIAWQESIYNDMVTGITPRQLVRLIRAALSKKAVVISACASNRLKTGALMWVTSVGLKNLQGLCEFEEANEPDTHIVLVENVTETEIIVINPDTRPTTKCTRSTNSECLCFNDGKWGRMRIARKDLPRVCRDIVLF